MKKTFLLITLILSSFIAISQCSYMDLYRFCDPDSVNMRHYEQWYLMPEDTYLQLDIFTGGNTETMNSLLNRGIYATMGLYLTAQPYRTEDTISIAGVSGYIYLGDRGENINAFEIRDSLLESTFAQVEIPYDSPGAHTPCYTEIFFEHPVRVCGKFYVVFYKDAFGTQTNPSRDYIRIFASSSGPTNPDMYAQFATFDGGPWKTRGLVHDYVGDTAKTAYLFPIIADSSYMNNNDTTDTDTVSGLNNINIDNFTHIFPNPTEDITEINCGYKIKILQVYNEAGILLNQYRPQAYNYRIDLGTYSKGTYIVKVITSKGTATKKLVKP